MDTLVSRVAYLNGLIEGMDIDKTSKEGKAISEIASILKEMAQVIRCFCWNRFI
jgi:hypothetical protein